MVAEKMKLKQLIIYAESQDVPEPPTSIFNGAAGGEVQVMCPKPQQISVQSQ